MGSLPIANPLQVPICSVHLFPVQLGTHTNSQPQLSPSLSQTQTGSIALHPSGGRGGNGGSPHPDCASALPTGADTPNMIAATRSLRIDHLQSNHALRNLRDQGDREEICTRATPTGVPYVSVQTDTLPLTACDFVQPFRRAILML
jgi:hypothetical protein